MTPPPLGRTLPNSPEAEEILLACILIDGPLVMSYCLEQKMAPEFFYIPQHQAIFRRMNAMYMADRELAAETLVEELRSHHELEQSGGMENVLRISSKIPTTARASYFANQVCRLHLLRVMIREGTSLVEKCYEATSQDGVEEITRPVERMLSLLAGSVPEREPTFAELVDEAEQWVTELEANEGKPSASIIPWPWPEMNKAFEPMERGQLVVIGAKTSVGKSSMVREVAIHCARETGPVYFVTLEVNPRQVVLQMASTIARIGLRELNDAPPTSFQTLKRTLENMKQMGINISRRDRSIGQICAKAKIHQARTPLAMIVVDYGGLIDDIACAKSSEQVGVIGIVLKTLKRLAGDLDCVVVLPWQLNRKSSYEGNREPRLSDLRQSGDVEQDTDKVIFIHRPEVNPITKLEQPETAPKTQVPRFYQDVIQAKGRNDGTARIGLYFERRLASFVSINDHATGHPSF